MPCERNGGSTVSGPSSSAGVSPMQIGVSRTEPTSSVPMRAVNDSSSTWPLPSRMRKALRAKRPGPKVRSCSRSIATASSAVSGRMVSESSLMTPMPGSRAD